MQLRLQLVEYVKWVAALAVELVYKYYHRGIAHTAYLHELACLLLDALGHVDHDYHRVDRREGAVCILGKVLVAGRVEDVYLVIAVVKAHHGGGHGYTALLLDFHPVAGGGLFDFVALHGAGHVDCSAVEEQFLGEGGLAGVGVRYDGESASPCYFVVDGSHLGQELAVESIRARQRASDSSQWGMVTPYVTLNRDLSSTL